MRSGDLSTVLLVPAPAHVLALLALSLDVLARGARVTFLARGLGLDLPLRASVRAQLAADALAAATPFRVGSDPAKIAVMSFHGIGVGAAGALLLGEMAMEATALVACGLAIAAGLGGMRWVAIGLFGYAAIVLSVGLLALLLVRAPDGEPPGLWPRVGLGVARWRALGDAITQFRTQARALRSLPARWIAAAQGATAIHIAARLAVLPALVLPSVGAAAATPDLVTELVLRPFFVLYATALLPPPGGGGAVEVAFAAVLSGTLGAAGLAAALIWWRVYTFYLSAAVGGVMLLLPSDTGRSTDRHRVFSAPGQGA
jgi:uncharacterized membrane protein YbhN (UPF0104 family)